MAKEIYFFTDVDINDQKKNVSTDTIANTGAFGEISDSQYRVTSIHTAQHEPKAIAIVAGTIVAVQDKDDPTIINLILKPTARITEITGKTFPAIKYILYKGVLKSSLVETVSGVEVISDPFNNNLSQYLYEKQNAINLEKEKIAVPPLSPGSIKDRPSAKMLRLDPTVTFSPDDDIDTLFYQSENAPYQIPPVKGGWHIGSFNMAKFGIEIIFDGVRTKSRLKNAQHVETIISPATNSTSTEEDRFKRKTEKEEVLNYMDPCAFYGSLFSHKKINYVYKTTDVKSKPEDTDFKTTVVPEDIYDKILAPLFFNKNVVYIDIRNEHNRSFNYLENYADIIRFNGIGKNYYTNWPITNITEKNGDLNYYDSISNSANASNLLKLEIPTSANKDENKKPLIYISNGYLKGITFPEELVNETKFVDTNNNFLKGYIKPIKLALPNIKGRGATAPLSFYVRIKYLKDGGSEAGTPDLVPRQETFADNIFLPLKTHTFFSIPANTKTHVVDEESYIKTDKISFSASIGIGVDVINTTFFAFAKEVNYSGVSSSFGLLSEQSNNPHFHSYIENKYKGRVSGRPLSFPTIKLLKGSYVIADSTTQNYLRFFESDPYASYSATSASPKLDEQFIAITLKSSTLAELIIDQDLDTDFDIFLVLKNKQVVKDSVGDDTPLISYDLKLVGYKANSGDLTLQEYDPGIIVFGYDDGGCSGTNIFVEKGATVDDTIFSIEDDVNKRCVSDTLILDELTNPVDVTGLKEFIQALQTSANSGFLPSQNLYDNIFNRTIAGSKGFKLSVSNQLIYDDTVAPTIGYIAEAAYIFAVWRLAKQLATTTTAIKPDIYLKLRSILVRPDRFKEPASTVEEQGIIDILKPTNIIGSSTTTTPFRFDTITDPLSKEPESVKERIYNLMALGYWDGGSSATQRFNFSTPYTSGTDTRILEHIEAILRDISGLLTIEVQHKASCFYNAFIKVLGSLLTNAPDAPESLMMATGDGSDSKGLLNSGDSFGLLFFTYKYGIENEKLALNSGTASKSFCARKEDVETVIHLSIFGLDLGIPTRVYVEITDDLGTFTCGFWAMLGSSGHVLDIFNDKKLFGVKTTSGTIDPTTITPSNPIGNEYDDIYNTENLGSKGTTFNSTMGDGSGEFKLASTEEIVARYNRSLNDLTIVRRNGKMDIKVTMVSAGAKKDRSNSTTIEEVQLMVSTVDGAPAKRAFTLEIENNYPQDKFELKKADKLALLALPQVQGNIDALIDTLLAIPQGNITINLKPQNIGKELPDGRYHSGISRLMRDVRYGFDLNRPVTEVADPIDYIDPGDLYDNVRVLEVPKIPQPPKNPNDMTALYNSLQYSFADVEFDDNNVEISIESYASPIWSRLDTINDSLQKKSLDNYSGTPTQFLSQLNSYAPDINIPDIQPYIRVAVTPGNTYVHKPSYNPVLTALRCYGMLEGIKDIIIKRATTTGKDANAINLKLTGVINGLSIPANSVIGIANVIPSSVFFSTTGGSFKWYLLGDDGTTTSDKSLYAPL